MQHIPTMTLLVQRPRSLQSVSDGDLFGECGYIQIWKSEVVGFEVVVNLRSFPFRWVGGFLCESSEIVLKLFGELYGS